MMEIDQIRAAVAIIEQKLPEKAEDKDLAQAVGTLLIAAVGSLAMIANSLEVIASRQEKDKA